MVIVFGILGLACILYGVSVMLIHSGTSFFVVWYVLGAALLACAWASHAGVWGVLPSLAKRIGTALLGVVLAAFLFTQGLIATQFGAKGEPGLDYIIVLGAQVRADGTPSAVLQFRLDAALDYLEANPNTICIVSGGQGPNEPISEAQCMAAYLQQHGVDSTRILREGKSQNTAQNIANSLAFLNPETSRVGIVTNDFHVFRGVSIARAAGMQHVCGIAAYSTPFYLPNNMLREGLGIAKDLFAGNLAL